jgi:hypothetical protein
MNSGHLSLICTHGYLSSKHYLVFIKSHELYLLQLSWKHDWLQEPQNVLTILTCSSLNNVWWKIQVHFQNDRIMKTCSKKNPILLIVLISFKFIESWYFLFFVVLGGGSVWHLQMFLHYIILEFTSSIIHPYLPQHTIPGIVSTGIIFPFTYMCKQYDLLLKWIFAMIMLLVLLVQYF